MLVRISFLTPPLIHSPLMTCVLECVFFFQAEDGIRDKLVTGVQTCALPIFVVPRLRVRHAADGGEPAAGRRARSRLNRFRRFLPRLAQMAVQVNKTRRDDQAGSVKYFGALDPRDLSARRNFRDVLAVEQDVAWAVGL